MRQQQVRRQVPGHHKPAIGKADEKKAPEIDHTQVLRVKEKITQAELEAQRAGDQQHNK